MRAEDLVVGLEVVHVPRLGERDTGKVIEWAEQYIPTFGTNTIVYIRTTDGMKTVRVEELRATSHILGQVRSDQETLLGKRLAEIGLTDGQIARVCDVFFSVCFGCFNVDVKEKCQCQNDE